MKAEPLVCLCLWSVLCLASLAALFPGAAAASEGPPERPNTRHVMFIGNNWDGTADIVDPTTFEHLGRINTIPDRRERMAEIRSSPDKLAFFLAIRQFVGEGNDQFTDDMFTTHDGRLVAVSRPSFADVVGIDLRTQKIVWRFPMEGYRADHMAVSPDGRRLLVSDSTANVVHELNIRTGEKTGEFPSGDSPHESNYSDDGSLIYHASIGRVYTPTDRCVPPLPLPLDFCFVRDTTKGDRRLQIVDSNTLRIRELWRMHHMLDEYAERTGEPRYAQMDGAVRPMALSPNERYAYLQISFFHGFVEFDLHRGRVTDVVDLPVRGEGHGPRENYLLDSAHHGLAMNPQGTRLCAAGTMSDYAAIVRRRTFEPTIASRGSKPYWSTNGPDGRHCWVSYSGDDEVAVVSYASQREIARIPVGDHPQRVRVGVVNRALVDSLPESPADDGGSDGRSDDDGRGDGDGRSDSGDGASIDVSTRSRGDRGGGDSAQAGADLLSEDTGATADLEADGGSLPFTGLGLAGLVVAGVALLATGVGAGRRLRR